jgi:hypothetical protein
VTGDILLMASMCLALAGLGLAALLGAFERGRS